MLDIVLTSSESDQYSSVPKEISCISCTCIMYCFNTTFMSLYRHVVCNVPVSCKANGVGNQLGTW